MYIPIDAPSMSDAELEPAIDWSNDDDVFVVGKKTDEDVVTKGWCDAKIAGMFLVENSLLDKDSCHSI